MDYISRLRRVSGVPRGAVLPPAPPLERLARHWRVLAAELRQPHQAALHHGVGRSDVPRRMRSLGDELLDQAEGDDASAEGLTWALDENGEWA